jgi:hypothetical protein
MDGREHEALIDDVLDRELQAALAVQPSPAFVARVRARVANEQMGAGWAGSWIWASLAVAAATLVGVAVLGGSPAVPAPASLVAIDTLPLRDLSGAIPAVVPMVAVGAAMPRGAGASRRRTPAPDVVVSPDEARARTILVDAIAGGLVQDGTMPVLEYAQEPLAPIDELVLEPIALSPLVRRDSGELDSAEGVRQ